MTKQEEFLWCVQTMLMLDAHNICLDLDVKDRHRVSVAGRMESVMLAVRASRSIPEDYTAENAAHEFFFWEHSLRNGGEKLAQPRWISDADLQKPYARS